MSFKDWKIGTRLGVGFGAMLVLVALIATTGVVRLDKVGNATEDMVDGPLVKERMVSEWARLLGANTVRTFAIVKAADPATEAYFKKELAAGQALINPLQEKLDKLLTSPEERKLYEAVAEARKRVLEMLATLNKLKAENNAEAAGKLADNEFAAGLVRYEKAVVALAEH